jgi:hypothetical protein
MDGKDAGVARVIAAKSTIQKSGSAQGRQQTAFQAIDDVVAFLFSESRYPLGYPGIFGAATGS